MVKKWSKTEATILSKRVELHKKYSTKNSPYSIKIEYKYLFNGLEYKNNTVDLAELNGGQTNYMHKTANQAINRIKEIEQIYVNPQRPEQSVVFCNGLSLYVFIALMGLMALIYSVANLSD